MISGDARWVATPVLPTQEDRDKAAGKKKEDKDRPKNGMALLKTADGTAESFERVESFAFSEDGRWIAYKHHEAEEEPEGEDAGEETAVGEAQPARHRHRTRALDLIP